MKLLTAASCACMAMVVSAATLGSPIAALKCANIPVRFPDAPEPVYVFNAKAVHADSLPPLNRDMIESVEVACADYIYDTFGIQARRAGIIIFSAPGPQAALRAAMDSIATLQAALLGRTGRVAATLAELGWSDTTGLITVELKIIDNDARWTATGTHRYLARSGVPVTVGGRTTLLR